MSLVKRSGSRPSSGAAAHLDLSALLQEQARSIPVLVTARFFWRELQEMQVWWPVLLPFLLWVGWRTYRQERQKVLQARHTARQRQ